MKRVLETDEFCTGCSTCKIVCPVNAISIEENEEGFLYPHIDKEKCINCNLCRKKCPVLNKSEKAINKKTYYAFCINDNEIWTRSTSGGAFTALCISWRDIKKARTNNFWCIYG